MRKMIRTYRELKSFTSFEERYQYLKLSGRVGEKTFGFDRILNQLLYSSPRWKRTRDDIIIRDMGCDLGIEGFELEGRILVHHMNPISLEDIEEENDDIFNPEFLICNSLNTHNAIHYGDETKLIRLPVARTRNDTCPWK